MNTNEDLPPVFGKSNKTPRTPTKNSNISLRVANEEISSKRRKLNQKPMDISELWEKLQQANQERDKKSRMGTKL